MATKDEDMSPASIVFGVLGILVSAFMLLSPSPLFNKIRNDKSVGNLKPWTYLFTLLNCIVGFVYGLLKGWTKGFALLITNGIGVLAYIIFAIIFYKYSTGDLKRYVIIILCLEIMFLLVLALPAIWLVPEKTITHTAGIASACVSTVMYLFGISPLINATKRHNRENMPILLPIAMTINCLFWMIYGIITNDLYVGVPNFIGLVIGICQLFLPWICDRLRGHGGRIESTEEHQVIISPRSS